MYMANWTLAEVLAAREHIGADLSEEDVRQRFIDVGGIVRHVYSEKYAGVLEEQQKKVNKLSLELLTDQNLAQAGLDDGG
jgi:hypothetical protein